MKQFFVTLAFLANLICPLPAQNHPQALPAAQPGSVTVVSDTTDTAYEAQIDSIIQERVHKQVNKEIKKWKRWNLNEKDGLPIKVFIIVLIFLSLPLLIVGIIFYYRYKSKKERYEVMKQALEHGKDLPPEFYDNDMMNLSKSGGNDLLWRKGVKRFFLGIGLALFLGIMTSEELSSIGILIMCIGVGEIVLGWMPSAPQGKNLRRQYGKEGNPLPETRQTEQADKKEGTEDNLPETKENPDSEENEESRTDKEVMKE